MQTKEVVIYSDDYRDQCFYAWYSAGRPRDIKDVIPVYTDGNKPTSATLQNWKRDMGWIQRADALDAQLSIQVDSEIIEQKKKDYMELAQTGRDIMLKAKNWLEDNDFDSSAAAVRAIGLGAEMIAKYSRAADMVDAVLGKTDKQITREILNLLGKSTDMEENTEEEVVDAGSEEDDND